MPTPSKIELPQPPADQQSHAVRAWRSPLAIDSYEPEAPSPYPAYLDARVYQGSSGRVYPLPFVERIASEKAPHDWDAVHLENEWIRLVILPELGGRIHLGLDKASGHDIFYRNDVIKPALVGLAGPWVSGGVEFNWPQHHRPATVLPTDCVIEREADGSVTVWCSDHDPFSRMKGMHGIRLRPDSSVIELRARLFNRTPEVQTFLWWANVAAAVGDDYQSFFPTDVHFVADHAKRAVTGFPRATTPYYGVDYPSRATPEQPDADRLDWYKNIPVPTSYMCLGSEDDFFGGYDHGKGVGFVHWADHTIAPGKKQWTWGNAPFGWAWDANLTDTNGPYVELMAGVYTDNQPDFSYLAPGETKTFSQYWYPIHRIGPAHQANLDASVSLTVEADASAGSVARVGVAVTRRFAGATVRLATSDGRELWSATVDLEPGDPLVETVPVPEATAPSDLVLTLLASDGETVLRWAPRVPPAEVTLPDPATEPPEPAEIASIEELYLTGVHLAQYRHATRAPEPYWEEALRRDPDDSRVNTALAGRLLASGRYEAAEEHLRRAITRQTFRNPNPQDGEAHYGLGLVLLRRGDRTGAYAALAKAAWNAAWRVPAHLALARIDLAEDRPDAALANLDQVLSLDGQHNQAIALRALALRILGRADEALAGLRALVTRDPLDWWARHLLGGGDPAALGCDARTALDVALEYSSAGQWREALLVLDYAVGARRAAGEDNVLPLVHYHRARALDALGRSEERDAALAAARTASALNTLPSGLDDVDVLNWAVERDPADARAHALLGHWLYSRHRGADAVEHWERARALAMGGGAEGGGSGGTGGSTGGSDPVVLRNLGLAAYNLAGDSAAAGGYYREAMAAAPADAALLYEYDQLSARAGVSIQERLTLLDEHAELVALRDDLTIERIRLLALAGRADEGYGILSARQFQPWEGGEGLAIGAWDLTARVRAGRALADAAGLGEADEAVRLLEEALVPPRNLGEARHLLANNAALWLELGDARRAAGDAEAARAAWQQATSYTGDFQSMQSVPYSEASFYSALAWRRLGDSAKLEAMAAGLAGYADELRRTPAKVDYFATSLPTLLLFTEDLDEAQRRTAELLAAQAAVLAGGDAASVLEPVLAARPDTAEARLLAAYLERGLVALP